MFVCLYNYLCHNIVGSADYVRLIRLINASRDQIVSSRLSATYITSGSFGEGLELNGSDWDIMILRHEIVATDQSNLQEYHSARNVVSVETNDVKPGFVYLRVIKGNTKNARLFCRGAQGQVYLSSVDFKMFLLNKRQSIIHGPCTSDKNGAFDFAFCLHSKSWISTALQWVTRSNNSWPTNEVKQRVIAHGVMFVPIGQEGDLNEELKWRISFSLGEKILIFTFSHTQLLCYALMKILLKDVISKSPGCKDLLCSYFIKTILFWLSEELPTSVWKPDNLIPCFMSTHHDAVLGWLMLATLFYKHKQYYKALCALSYSLTKCTTEKLDFGGNITDVHRNLLRNKIFRKLKIIRTLRFLLLLPKSTDFEEKNNSIPDELNMYDNDFNPCSIIPPVTYLHFLTFLCHYRLYNIRNYQESLGDLRLTIEEDYFISDIAMKAAAYDCLGVAFQIIGDTEAAKEAFVKSTEIFPDQLINRSFQRLAILNSCID
ncbi:Hypothetical predicted protein [Mytilus galloprovincialis]|uniref:Mab-21-like HhH/H2TH-like domain-containing protein n=1 Tax=Mytilus galloprovincialis TaxID=29158 RepID=A0A8B6EN32_MYTGA|nr:Hypothetical predicted protein [Mytilus galloprovincialis]